MNWRRTAAVLAAVTSMAAGACAPATGVTPSSTTTEAAPDVTIVPGGSGSDGSEVSIGIGDYPAPRTLNPFLDGPDTALLDLIAPALFATGYDIDPQTLQPVPDVLEGIPSLANGGIVVNANGTMDVTFRISPGAVWADGTRISAADLQFTIETVTDPNLPIRRDLSARYEKIVPGSIRASGLELKFRMDIDPSVELLFDLILPAHVVSGSDFVADWNDRLWVSGAPFQIESYQPGQYLALERNERYWKVDPATGDPLPHFDRLVVRFFEGGDSPDPRLLRAFQAQDLDLALMGLPTEVADAYLELQSAGARIVSAPGLAWEQINFQFGPGNRNQDSLNRYRQFRLAVAHAIDRTRLAELRGTFPLSSVLRAYLPDLTEDPWATYEYDPEETAALLFALGDVIGEDLFAGDGPRLVVTTSSDSTATVTLAGEIVVMLNDAGIGAELQLEDSALFFGQTLDNGTWDVAAWKFVGSPGRTGAVAFVEMFDPDGLPFVGNNFFRWGTVDSLVTNRFTRQYATTMDALRETIDPAEMDRLLIRAETLLAEQMVLLPLIVHEQSGAVLWMDRVAGVTANPAQSELWDVENWKPPES